MLHRGEAFGHLALIHPRAPRTRTVTAAAASSSSSGGGAGGGDNGGGVHLAVLPRSTINHMRFVGDAQVGKPSNLECARKVGRGAA